MVVEDLLVDLRAVEVAELDFADDGMDGLDDLDAAAVTEGEDEDEAGVFARGLDAFVELVADALGEIGEAADGLEAGRCSPSCPGVRRGGRSRAGP